MSGILPRSARTMAALAGACLLAVSLPSPVAAEAVPRVDPTQSCAAARRGGDPQTDLKNCIQEEQGARDQLAKEWGKFRADDRTSCVQLSTLGGSPSYVEILTCLEMAAAARESSADAGALTIPSAAAPERPARHARTRGRVFVRVHAGRRPICPYGVWTYCHYDSGAFWPQGNWWFGDWGYHWGEGY